MGTQLQRAGCAPPPRSSTSAIHRQRPKRARRPCAYAHIASRQSARRARQSGVAVRYLSGSRNRIRTHWDRTKPPHHQNTGALGGRYAAVPSIATPHPCVCDPAAARPCSGFDAVKWANSVHDTARLLAPPCTARADRSGWDRNCNHWYGTAQVCGIDHNATNLCRLVSGFALAIATAPISSCMNCLRCSSTHWFGRGLMAVICA